MSKPTLEEIAANGTDLPPRYPTVLDSVLARELIALRERLDGVQMTQEEGNEIYGEKLAALDGMVNATYESGSSCEAEFRERLTALEQQSRAYAEDGALAAGRGAGDVRNEGRWTRDTGYVPLSDEQVVRNLEVIAERDVAIAQRDTARAALRKYGVHQPRCFASNTRTHGMTCTCGLTQALAGGEANEGSES